ncbi:MAG: hypothetical protein EOM68_22200 [Spirochaetia bacterium]|nr:hypothetical protein [Spirochaetia bacterium]
MEIKNTQSYDRYHKGMELQNQGYTPDEIAKELGMRDGKSWIYTRARYSGTRLAERTIPKTKNEPEPAPILDGVDCQRTAPRQISEAFTLGLYKANDESTSARAMEEIGKKAAEYIQDLTADLSQPLTNNHPAPALAPKRLSVEQMFSADGEKVRYRMNNGMVQIHAKGQKRCAITLSIDEAKMMVAELTGFLNEIEEWPQTNFIQWNERVSHTVENSPNETQV